MTVSQYRAAKKQALKGKGIGSVAKKLVKKVRGNQTKPAETKKETTKKVNTPTVKKVDKPVVKKKTTTAQTTPKKDNKLKIKSTTKGGPVKSGVEYARSKGDDLAGFRRTKDTRITKRLKAAGFTEDRLARLRKKHAEFKARKKKKKKFV